MDIANLNKKADLTEGEWIEDIPDNPGLRLKVRSTNYKPYKVATAGLGRRSTRQLETDEGMLEFTVALGKPIGEHLLLDWDGVKSGGKQVPYSKETALSILTADDDFGIGQQFRSAVGWAANRAAENLKKATKAAEKN